MKIADLLNDAGRPIAYYPALRRIAGSINAAVLLCQLMYWHGKQRDPSGWIMKRASGEVSDPPRDLEDHSLEAETGLSAGELRVARRLLKSRGLIKERHHRPTHCTFFRVELAAIQAAWEAEPASERMSCRPSADAPQSVRECTAEPPLNGDSIDHTETTAERPVATQIAAVDPVGKTPATPIEALQHPMLQLFQQTCGRVPGMRDYAAVIDLMRHFHARHGDETSHFLRPFWLAWSSRKRSSDGRPYDPGSLTWLSEWAMNGQIPETYGGRHDRANTERSDARRGARKGQEARAKAHQGRPLPAADQAAARRINHRRRGKVPPVP